MTRLRSWLNALIWREAAEFRLLKWEIVKLNLLTEKRSSLLLPSEKTKIYYFSRSRQKSVTLQTIEPLSGIFASKIALRQGGVFHRYPKKHKQCVSRKGSSTIHHPIVYFGVLIFVYNSVAVFVCFELYSWIISLCNSLCELFL